MAKIVANSPQMFIFVAKLIMLHTKKEFSAKCGMPTNRLATYIGRGKVILLGDGMINDEDPRNRDFLLKHGLEDAKIIEIEKPTNTKTQSNASIGDKYTLEVEKLEKTNKKLDVETRLAELKEEKIRGEVIPIALVSTIFKTHTQQIVTSQKEFIENMLISLSKEYRFNGEQLARLRGKMVNELNIAVDKAILASKRNLKSVVDEFSIKKEIGEHD